METTKKYTSADLALIPDDGKRYEIIDGELFISSHPHALHQFVCGKLASYLSGWNDEMRTGVALIKPGLVLGEYDDVVPDVVWVSHRRLAGSLNQDGHFTRAPELVAEVLSPDKTDERRDRVAKLTLYSRHGVLEYWIVDWMQRLVEVYRRERGALKRAATLYADDALESPTLPGFSCRVSKLFFSQPTT